MIETEVWWLIQQHILDLREIPRWADWDRYTSEEIAQTAFALLSARLAGTEWRIAKETVTVTLEEVPNAVGVEK